MTTPNLNLTQLSATNSERIAINQNWDRIDGIFSRVADSDVNLTDFPASPTTGRTILLAVATGTAATLGLTGHIATYNGSAWVTVPPSVRTPPMPTETAGYHILNPTLNGWIPYVANVTGTATIGSSGLTVNEETLTADKTLLTTDDIYQMLDPGGANRVVTLPPNANGRTVVIEITGGTVNTIEVVDATLATVTTLTDQPSSPYRVELISSATNWYAKVLTKV